MSPNKHLLYTQWMQEVSCAGNDSRGIVDEEKSPSCAVDEEAAWQSRLVLLVRLRQAQRSDAMRLLIP